MAAQSILVKFLPLLLILGRWNGTDPKHYTES